MIKTRIFNPTSKPTLIERETIIQFLYQQLEQYGDPKEDIAQCVDYALKEVPSFGGFILTSYDDDNHMSGAVIINRTGMKDYIPENILVYIATRNDLRGKGIGKKLMNDAMDLCQGNIALHVEPDNPAKNLYEHLGFTNKYLEMRYTK